MGRRKKITNDDSNDTFSSKRDKYKVEGEYSYGIYDYPPPGCEACGGPYPLCKDGCSLFDDD